MLKIAVLASGGGTDLQSIIDGIKSGMVTNGQITLVVTNRKNAYALERARKENIKAEVIRDNTVLLQRLKEENIDLVVLAGYLAIIPAELIQHFENRIINIHPSLIPSFCGPGFYGMHVHNAVLERGAKVSGATVHFVSEVVDGGPIILQEACAIDDLDEASLIQERVLEIEHRILPKAVDLFCNGRIKVENGKVRIV